MAYFREWACEVSDFHGLKHIAGQGGIFRRLIWIIFTVGLYGAFFYQTALLFQYFFERHHITKVDVSYNETLEFPAVTICNFNKYRESALTEDDIKNVGIHLGIIDEDHNLIYPGLYTTEFQNKLAAVNWTNVEEDENYNMTDFQLRTGHQLEDMMIECTWKDEPCEVENFTHIFTHLGNCYQFNAYSPGSERLSSYAAGPANGLKLMIDIEEEEYVPSNDLDGGAIDAGIMVMVHDPTEPPYVKEFGMPTGPGHHTVMSMRHEQITALPSPFTECETDGDINYYDHYSLQACRIECETDLVIAECGCKLPEQPGDFDVCGPNDFHECAHPALVKAIHGTSEYGTCDCASPCNAEIFPLRLANTKLRATFVEKLLQQNGSSFNLTASYIESNVVALSIYYEALNFELIEQIPAIGVITLMATIGGNMGLFTGAGLLTIIQLLEYVIDETLTCCKCTRDTESDETKVCCGCSKKNNQIDDWNTTSGGKEHNDAVAAWPTS